VVSTMSLRRDRRELAWAGGALLAAASWVRLWDLGVSSPEAYTLPSAALLVLAGLDRLRRDRSVGTMAALAPGLSLALVPTLLWALVDPVGLRPLLLGLGCLAMVLVGARLGWTAPIALGAAAGAVLLLRLAAPYVGDAVPRWVLIAAAGAVLVALGATWERRLADARSVTTYVRDLR
jgi:cell division protein FtsW (lipid II flippase)